MWADAFLWAPGPTATEQRQRPSSFLRIHELRVPVSDPTAHHPFLSPRHKARGAARVSASESIVFLIRTQRPIPQSSRRRRLRRFALASALRPPLRFEGSDGVHRRDAPRAAGQPPAQAAAARVGRRSRRDVPGYAAAARLGRRPRRDVSGITSFAVSVFLMWIYRWGCRFSMRSSSIGAVVLGLSGGSVE